METMKTLKITSSPAKIQTEPYERTQVRHTPAELNMLSQWEKKRLILLE
jgi:hypothetical protein